MRIPFPQRYFLIGVLVWAFGLVSNAAFADADTDRVVREARHVFEVVLSKEKAPKTCQYDFDWDDHAIPDYVAQQVFKLTVHAGLVAPFEKGDYRSVLDPMAMHQAAFCTPEALKAYTTIQIESYEKRTVASVNIERTLFAFPVFDESLETAVVVVTYRAEESRSRRDGKNLRFPGEESVDAKIYKKVHGTWRFDHAIQLEVT